METHSSILAWKIPWTEEPGRLQFSSVQFSSVQLLSHVHLFENLQIAASQAPLSMGFSRQEYKSGLPFPSPGDLPKPGIDPGSPALQILYHVSHQAS